MKCPNKECAARNDQLNVPSTFTHYTDVNHRYRVCSLCGSSFQTVETIMVHTIVISNYVPDDTEGTLFETQKVIPKKEKI